MKGYNAIYCDKLIEHMGKGFTFESFASVVNVSPSQLGIWREEFPEFEEACEIGKQICSVQWQQRLMDIADGEKGNAPAVMFGLKNYDPGNFKEKSHIEQQGTAVLMVDTGIDRSKALPDNSAVVECDDFEEL